MGVGDFVNALRRIDRLLSLEKEHGAAIEKLEAELAGLKSRVNRLESREDLLIAEARGAAGAAASAVMTSSVADLARRIGVLEERSFGQRRPRGPALEPP